MNPPSDTCILYLLRHAATDSNLANPPVLQGCRVNQPLSSHGRAQAERTASFLTRRKIRAVYSSPLLRAAETAECIARPHGLPVRTIGQIHEVDVGRWERRSWVEIAETEPEAYRLFMTQSATHGYAGGENMTQVFERVAPALREVLSVHLGQEIVVVGHNVANRVFLAHVLGVPLDHNRLVHQDNCGISIIRYREGKTQVLTLNSTFHLDVDAAD